MNDESQNLPVEGKTETRNTPELRSGLSIAPTYLFSGCVNEEKHIPSSVMRGPFRIWTRKSVTPAIFPAGTSLRTSARVPLATVKSVPSTSAALICARFASDGFLMNSTITRSAAALPAIVTVGALSLKRITWRMAVALGGRSPQAVSAPSKDVIRSRRTIRGSTFAQPHARWADPAVPEQYYSGTHGIRIARPASAIHSPERNCP
jgi:hypothetical protein